MPPPMKPGGRADATPRYGSGNVNKYTDIGTTKDRQNQTNISVKKHEIKQRRKNFKVRSVGFFKHLIVYSDRRIVKDLLQSLY